MVLSVLRNFLKSLRLTVKDLLAVTALCLAVHAHAAIPTPSDPQLAYVAWGGGIGGTCEIFAQAAHVKDWRSRLLIDLVAASSLTLFVQQNEGRTWENTGNRVVCAGLGAVGAWTIAWGSQ